MARPGIIAVLFYDPYDYDFLDPEFDEAFANLPIDHLPL